MDGTIEWVEFDCLLDIFKRLDQLISLIFGCQQTGTVGLDAGKFGQRLRIVRVHAQRVLVRFLSRFQISR